MPRTPHAARSTPDGVRSDAPPDRAQDPTVGSPPDTPADTPPRTRPSVARRATDGQAPPLPLPYERDQGATPATGAHGPGPVDPVGAQAHRDLARGLVDTDLRATPGLDAQRREQLVPGSARRGGGR